MSECVTQDVRINVIGILKAQVLQTRLRGLDRVPSAGRPGVGDEKKIEKKKLFDGIDS
jgi:hypothetical protein